MGEVLVNNYIYRMVYEGDGVYHKDHSGEDLEGVANKDHREVEVLAVLDEVLAVLDEVLVVLDEVLGVLDEDRDVVDNKVLHAVEDNKDHKEREAKA